MAFGTLVVSGVAAVAAAEIATWCFRSAAKQERQRRRDVVHSERGHRAAIERDARRRLAQEAYEQRGAWLAMLSDSMGSVWDMRKKSRGLLRQTEDIVQTNKSLMRDSPLTFQQQEAIRDCIFHLDRGISRLRAYSGPYLQSFIDEISSAKQAALNDSFREPEMPDAFLPYDFPVVGDQLRLSGEEARNLVQTGRVPIGGGEFGVLAGREPTAKLDGGVNAFVSAYDQDTGCWRLSLACGAIATAGCTGEAEPIQATLISPTRGGCRAVWHSPFGESVQLFMPFSLAEPSTRNAPWGTTLRVFVHQVDYLGRSIVVGQQAPARPDDDGDSIAIASSSAAVQETIERAFHVSPSTFWRRPDLSGDPAGADLIMRVATGEEFPATLHEQHGYVDVGEQSGYRLGLVEGAICRSFVRLLAASSPLPNHYLRARAFFDRITGRLEEQDELQEIFKEESLETRKYQLLLESELAATQASSRVVCDYTQLHLESVSATDSVNQRRNIVFTVDALPRGDLEDYAVEVFPENSNDSATSRVCGFVKGVERDQNTVICSFPDDLLQFFQSNRISTRGKLECSSVDVDTRRQVRALEQFRTASSLQGKSAEDRESFRNLRRVLLGLSLEDHRRIDLSAFDLKYLNVDQRRAAELINSDNPLTLVLGPPGTGKTDTIAIAVDVFLRRNPEAKVAIVSQANVAVREALNKLREHFPDCDIVWQVSAKEQERIEQANDNSNELTQHALREDFEQQLATQPVLPEWGASIRDQFREAYTRYGSRVNRRVLKLLVHATSVSGCTLSILGRLAIGAPLFDLVVVDEAAKASLPECLIAALTAKHLVLVGDHHQLLPFLDERILERSGPTREDQRTVRELWNNSLFRRLWDQAPNEVKVLLKTQYRSRSAIRQVVSDLFYEEPLLPGRTDYSRKVPSSCSLVWVDTKGGREHQRSVKRSLVNDGETETVLAVLGMLKGWLPDPSSTTVAVLCLYGEQQKAISRRVSESEIEESFDCCEVRTVHASQGGQWDVVVLSLSRCAGPYTFVGNANALNVAISRGRELTVVVGSLSYALHDSNPESSLGALAEHVQNNKGDGVWICAPGPRGGIAQGFNYRGARRKGNHGARK